MLSRGELLWMGGYAPVLHALTGISKKKKEIDYWPHDNTRLWECLSSLRSPFFPGVEPKPRFCVWVWLVG